MQFDPASVASLLATLQARAWAGQLTFTTRTATAFDPVYVDHAIAPAFRPLSASWRGRSIIQWSATYRSPAFKVLNPDGVTTAYVTGGLQRSFRQQTYVCDTVNLLVAQGLVLDFIQQAFDLHDQRSKAANLVPQMNP